jgi:tetratricopeptide (TPR) repeat protein
MPLTQKQRDALNYEIATDLFNEKKANEAIDFLKQIPIDCHVANFLGCCLWDLCNYSEAEESFLKAIEINPQMQDAWRNLAMLYKDIFQPFESIKAYEQYLKFSPGDTVALFEYASVFLELNEEDKAYEILKKAHQIDPRDVYVIINLSLIILHKKKRPRVALRLLKKAAIINPVDADVLFHLADVAWDLGEELTSLNARDMLQSIDPALCAELDERTGRQRWI